MPVTDASLSELYRTIRDEYGGQLYRATVVGPSETVLYEGSISIAAAPRQAGRVLDRESWDRAMAGTSRVPSAAATPTPAASTVPVAGGGVLELVSLLFQQQRDSTQANLEAVRDLVGNTQQMVARVLEERERRAAPSLSDQLAGLVESNQALQRVSRAFGAAASPSEDGGAVDAAQTQFLGVLAQSLFGGANRPNGAPQAPGNIPEALNSRPRAEKDRQ